MGKVHDLIIAQGKQGVLSLDIERRIVEAASNYLAVEESPISFLYSGFAHVGLPHKKLDDSEAWQVTTDRASMVVSPGRKAGADGKPVFVGVPYGSKARLIMIYLQTEALRTENREVELGGSLRAWLKRMGISVGGKSVNDVREQADRIARCLFTFEFKGVDSSGFMNQTIVDSGMFENDSSLLECVKLSETFYQQLQKHPIPIEEAAIRELNGHSQALDIYCWLAYRLHVLKQPTPVTWTALKAQFGAGTARMDHFKTGFITNLKLALAVYPEAEVLVLKEGVILHPARPPVSPKIIPVKSTPLL